MNNENTAKYWDASSDNWYKDVDSCVKEIIENPEIAFPKSVLEMMKSAFESFKGLKVCVPSSGDNTAVFAFHLLGAKVTSMDISSKQVENGQDIAQKNNWDIDFICDDSMTLRKVEDAYYDLVYTSNGVHVWISDLETMYKNFNRILKKGGQYMFFETHPMTRPFDRSGEDIIIAKEYSNVGPIIEDGIYRYEWRIQDFINALVRSNLEIGEMIEFNSKASDFIKYDYVYNSVDERLRDNCSKYDWRVNPWYALPQCLGIMSKKK